MQNTPYSVTFRLDQWTTIPWVGTLLSSFRDSRHNYIDEYLKEVYKIDTHVIRKGGRITCTMQFLSEEDAVAFIISLS